MAECQDRQALARVCSAGCERHGGPLSCPLPDSRVMLYGLHMWRMSEEGSPFSSAGSCREGFHCNAPCLVAG